MPCGIGLLTRIKSLARSLSEFSPYYSHKQTPVDISPSAMVGGCLSKGITAFPRF